MKIKKERKILAWVLAMCMVAPMCTPQMDSNAASRVKLNKSSVTLVVGESKTLKVKNTKKKVRWMSSKTKVVTVTQKGVVKAKRAGNAKIYAKVAGKMLTCRVKVKSNMTLNKTDLTLAVGKSDTLKVKNASGTVEWSSNDPDIATVTKNGVVTGVSAGTAEIIAEVGEDFLTCNVTVLGDTTSKADIKENPVQPQKMATVIPVKTESVILPEKSEATQNPVPMETASAGLPEKSEATQNPVPMETAPATLPEKSEATQNPVPIETALPEKSEATQNPVPIETMSAGIIGGEEAIASPMPVETMFTEKPIQEEATPVVTSFEGVIESPAPEIPATNMPVVSKVTVSTKTKEGGVFVIGRSTQQITFRADAVANNVKVEVVNANNEIVYTQTYPAIEKDTDTIFNWNGKNASGTYVEPGVYRAVITANNISETSEMFQVIDEKQAGYTSIAVVDIEGNTLSSANVQISCISGNSYSENSVVDGKIKGNYPIGQYQYTAILNGYDQASGTFTIKQSERNRMVIVMLPSDLTVEESGIQNGIIWKITKGGDLLLTGKFTGTGDGHNVSFENSQWRAYKSSIRNAYVDVENLTSLKDMFYDFSALKHVSFGNQMKQGTVVTMRSAFNKAIALTSVDVTNLNTENVTDMHRAFSDCSDLTSLDLSDFDTKNVTDMSWMFFQCLRLTELNVSSFDVTNLETMEAMFNMCNSIEEIDLSGWGKSNVKTLTAAFYNLDSLKCVNMNHFVTSQATSMESMFGYCPKLTSVLWEDIDVSNVTTTKLMFERCASVGRVNLTGWDLSKVTDMEGMFAFCSGVRSINLSGMDLSNVITMEAMFYECKSLTQLDLTGINTENVKNMSKIFSDCSALTTIDLTDLDTGNVTEMDYMFKNCTAMNNLKFKDFDTSNAVNMEGMFLECSSLTSLDLSSFNTKNVTNMKAMFDKCYVLTDVNLRSFDTSKVTDMGGMFERCQSLSTIDISSFNTENVISMQYMFYLCSGLQRIKVGSKWSMTRVSKDGASYMFNGCGVSSVTYV